MLKNVRLENFRGFKSHETPLNQTDIVVGKNNAGKSTLVEALRLIALVSNRYHNAVYKAVHRRQTGWLKKSREEGLEKGRQEGLEKTARNLLLIGKLTTEQIAEVTGLSSDRVKEISASVQA